MKRYVRAFTCVLDFIIRRLRHLWHTQMAFDPTTLITRRDWLTTSVEYQGDGEIVLGALTFGGPTNVRVDEEGSVRAEMRLTRVPAARDPASWVLQILSTPRALADRFRVDTPNGTITAQQVWISGGTAGFSVAPEGSAAQPTLRLQPISMQFDVGAAGTPTFWISPLINLAVDFAPPPPTLFQHPLRLRPIAPAPPGLSERDKARVWAFLGNERLVAFQFSGAPAFIEPLDDYDARVQRLQNGEARRLITSVMVGSRAGLGATMPQIEQWFPFDLRWLLGLASGNEVGFSWIEVRDADGLLVRRLHLSQSPTLPFDGAVPRQIRTGQEIGTLLTRAQAAPDFGSDWLRVGILRAVSGGPRSQWIFENAIMDLCMALDGVCEHHGTSTQNLLAILGPADRQAVQSLLDAARNGITSLAPGKPQPEADALNTIASRARSAADTAREFGLAVAEMLDLLGFHDHRIMNTYYRGSRPGPQSWSELLTRVRGAVAHQGFLDWARIGITGDELLALTRHLHDILVRICLTRLGYPGTYLPSVRSAYTADPVKWVQTTTTPKDLGYP